MSKKCIVKYLYNDAKKEVKTSCLPVTIITIVVFAIVYGIAALGVYLKNLYGKQFIENLLFSILGSMLLAWLIFSIILKVQEAKKHCENE